MMQPEFILKFHSFDKNLLNIDLNDIWSKACPSHRIKPGKPGNHSLLLKDSKELNCFNPQWLVDLSAKYPNVLFSLSRRQETYGFPIEHMFRIYCKGGKSYSIKMGFKKFNEKKLK